MSKAYIHTVESVDFQITGFGFLDVTSFSMTLEPGGIPTASVGVALAGGGRRATNGNNTTVNLLSVGETARRFGMLMRLAEKNTLCNLRFRLITTRANDGAKGTQEILLKGWILTAVGIGNLTTTRGFQVKCSISHPVYNLSMHGGFCTNFNQSLGLEKLIGSVKDPLSAGVAVYDKISKLSDANKLKFLSSPDTIHPGGKNATDIMKEVNSVFGTIPKLLDQYLEWKPELGGGKNGIPFSKFLTSNMEKAAKKVMMETWIPVGTNSVWDILIGSTCAEFDLTVIPDYTKDKLPITPYYPWLSATMELNEEDMFDITFPGTDPAPIYGLTSSPQMINTGNLYIGSFSGTEGENLLDKASVLAYVPSANSDINGKFFSGALPEWLVAVCEEAPGFAPQEPKMTGFSGDHPGNTSGSGDNEEMKKSNSFKMQCLAQEFLKMYKKRLEATITCPLLFSRNGEDPFLPGKVLSIRTSKGYILFEGYVVSLTHSIDMESGGGATSFHLAYCRPEGGYPIVKEVMDKNPMYS